MRPGERNGTIAVLDKTPELYVVFDGVNDLNITTVATDPDLHSAAQHTNIAERFIKDTRVDSWHKLQPPVRGTLSQIDHWKQNAEFEVQPGDVEFICLQAMRIIEKSRRLGLTKLRNSVTGRTQAANEILDTLSKYRA